MEIQFILFMPYITYFKIKMQCFNKRSHFEIPLDNQKYILPQTLKTWEHLKEREILPPTHTHNIDIAFSSYNLIIAMKITVTICIKQNAKSK